MIPHEDARDDLDAVTVLSEPHRRALYEYVVERRDWVSREQAAAATGLGRGVAAHHLDRLADAGLLETDSRRLNDRTGPGAGRPAKVYRRAPAEVSVSLPPRAYELAGRVLAAAADESRRDGTLIEPAIDRAARRAGAAVGARLRRDDRASVAARRARVLDELGECGFEPELQDDGVVVLHNCPFHHLAQEHTQLICGMNLGFVDSLVEAAEGTDLHAVLEPAPGSCCVRLHTRRPDPN